MHCDCIGLRGDAKASLCEDCRKAGHSGVPMDCDLCLERIFGEGKKDCETGSLPAL